MSLQGKSRTEPAGGRRERASEVESDTLDSHGVARLMGTHVETIRRLARKGRIPAYKLGKDWRFSRSTLRRWTDAHHTRMRSPLVMVVDDEKNIRKTTRLCLESEGYRVATCAGGEDAIESARLELPDLVLLDLVMTGMDGVDTLKMLLEMKPDLAVIIVTAYPHSELMAEALRCAPVTFLPKPLEKSILIKTLKRTLYGMKGSR